jgi:formyltetrahydrofolate-dependent phosphoribosylglycinamide formyltransferase
MMLEQLQKKWNISGSQFILVLLVFALGGSATGYLGKIIMNWLQINTGWLWTLIYIIVVTLLWPLNVLLVSIPFGQFKFFSHYLRTIGKRIIKKNLEVTIQNPESRIQNPEFKNNSNRKPLNIAILASGPGTNAQKIIDHFKNHPFINVSLVACNKPGAGVLAIAANENIPTILIEKEKFFRGDAYLHELKSFGIDFIVLAGFLWKIPQSLIDAYRNRIVNIHPALLPKYGGKGMYGNSVHQAVINAREKESGITIHYVDEHYDNGDIIFQDRVNISMNETPDTLSQKIHQLEYKNYPRIIEQMIVSQMVVKNQ